VNVLELHDLTVRYGETVAVREATLSFAGGLLALVGESGCGKTSLLRAIAGFERPSGGEIRVSGTIVASPTVDVKPEVRGVGLVFQEGALFPHLSVWDNVRYGIRGRLRSQARARELLTLVRLAELADRFPDELSGGQQQRVALARALAPRPRLVLFDEPFAGLDPGLREELRDEVGVVLRETSTDAVLVTHDREESLAIADRLAVMAGGRLLQVDTPETVYARPANLEVARFMGSGALVPCTVESGSFECGAGKARCDAPDGHGMLLLRPEDVRLRLSQPGDGIFGTIQSRAFRGAHVLDSIRLSSGLELQARVLSGDTLPVGTSVAVELRERSYRVFPTADAPGARHETRAMAGPLAESGRLDVQ
jgi:iron(III) transport system ATP-binding protein